MPNAAENWSFDCSAGGGNFDPLAGRHDSRTKVVDRYRCRYRVVKENVSSGSRASSS